MVITAEKHTKRKHTEERFILLYFCTLDLFLAGSPALMSNAETKLERIGAVQLCPSRASDEKLRWFPVRLLFRLVDFV
jgi:hypothetical protein